MGLRTLATGLAVNRVLFGLGFILMPRRSVRGWIGDRSARNDGAQLLTRALGARDLALGLGGLAALSADDGTSRRWFAGQALADGTDFLATLVADDLPLASRIFGLVMAGTSAGIATAYAAGAGAAGESRALDS